MGAKLSVMSAIEVGEDFDLVKPPMSLASRIAVTVFSFVAAVFLFTFAIPLIGLAVFVAKFFAV